MMTQRTFVAGLLMRGARATRVIGPRATANERRDFEDAYIHRYIMRSPRRRMVPAHVRVFEIPSLIDGRAGSYHALGVSLAPRINNPATKVRWVIILKRGAWRCGTLVHHP